MKREEEEWWWWWWWRRRGEREGEREGRGGKREKIVQTEKSRRSRTEKLVFQSEISLYLRFPFFWFSAFLLLLLALFPLPFEGGRGAKAAGS